MTPRVSITTEGQERTEGLAIRPCRAEECDEAQAVAVWDALADAGYQRDPRMMRYMKALTA